MCRGLQSIQLPHPEKRTSCPEKLRQANRRAADMRPPSGGASQYVEGWTFTNMRTSFSKVMGKYRARSDHIGGRAAALRLPITQETLYSSQPPGERRCDRSRGPGQPYHPSWSNPLGYNADVLALQSHVGTRLCGRRVSKESRHHELSNPINATSASHKFHRFQNLGVLWSIITSLHYITHITQSRLTNRESILRCHYTASSRSLEESLQGSRLAQTLKVSHATSETKRHKASFRVDWKDCE
ncbi:predicted protein [Plenodomus lingam JN3]|uniref:Predicted protein n=1 Tax=Leptosphaeria maculans (strain JN3 / isolate v23.1.3 / race Av1-4-5-6-7-8) TaxID=985895 RepID=E4ZWP5_LEPMJ|nr:predicted protein [Plenodomus lingam JN3]CBX96021.1 predicted protein [Plenodomus lingam JN3]